MNQFVVFAHLGTLRAAAFAGRLLSTLQSPGVATGVAAPFALAAPRGDGFFSDLDEGRLAQCRPFVAQIRIRVGVCVSWWWWRIYIAYFWTFPTSKCACVCVCV